VFGNINTKQDTFTPSRDQAHHTTDPAMTWFSFACCWCYSATGLNASALYLPERGSKEIYPASPLGFFCAQVCFAGAGHTVQNPVLMATLWLHDNKIERAHY
jgi:hypothetical protein